MTMGELYDKTLEKQHNLERTGYLYRSFWKFEFDRQITADYDMKTFVDSLEITSFLEIRDAFRGSTTENLM